MHFKNATIEDLRKFAHEKREELRSLRFSASGSKNRNVKSARVLRRDIARAETEISAKQNQ